MMMMMMALKGHRQRISTVGYKQCCCTRDHGLGLEAKSAGLGLGLGLELSGLGLGLAFKQDQDLINFYCAISATKL